MCGINGIVSSRSELSLFQMINNMNNVIVHRGPDDDGVFLDDQVALGMRRLSIIDIHLGQQPVFCKDKRYVIVFNGEIYNYKELKLLMQETGYVFGTNSDTEVVLALYIEFGERCVDHLIGMFAFSIFDKQEKVLFITRDRFGEKPLYYHYSRDIFIWSSELKSIMEVNPSLKEVSQESVDLYFALSYIPAPKTIYKNIYKLEPGYYIKFNVTTFEFNKVQYWDLGNLGGVEEKILDYSVAMDRVNDLLFDSVEKRMLADVELGAFLSGGVDSAIIAAIMSKISSTKIKTFTIGFNNKRYDETVRAKLIGKHIKSEHYHYQLDYNDMLAKSDYIIENYDEPFADPSSIPFYFLSKFSRNHIKVALTGDGGDEVFGGYNKYLLYTIGKKINKFVPVGILKRLLEVYCLLFDNLDSKSRITMLRKFLDSISSDTLNSHLSIIQLGFRNEELTKILLDRDGKTILHTLNKILGDLRNNCHSDFQKIRYADFKISLDGDLLTKVDRASMLNSMECRAPFLDHKLVDFVFGLPDDFLIRGNNKKRILKDSFKWAVPPGYFQSPKSGFELPIASWFRCELKSDLENNINKDILTSQNYINASHALKLYSEHQSGYQDHSWKLWTLYVFQKWYARNIA